LVAYLGLFQVFPDSAVVCPLDPVTLGRGILDGPLSTVTFGEICGLQKSGSLCVSSWHFDLHFMEFGKGSSQLVVYSCGHFLFHLRWNFLFLSFVLFL
jgi:hypothetical protein